MYAQVKFAKTGLYGSLSINHESHFTMHLPHLASRLYGTPLLIARAKLDVILSVLGERIGWPQPETALPLPPPRPRAETPPGIALIPVVGTLVRRTLGMEAASGLTSYGEIAALVDEALADTSVEGILLDVDSPGGEAGGVFELGERIRAADAVKPVWAIANDAAFSAAYAIGCAASRLTLTRTAGVGSIGVIAMHVDQTVRDAQQGYHYTAITAGSCKNDFSPHEALDREASARLQAEVDRLYGLFVDHVATLRQIDPKVVRATEAGLYFGADAIHAGLADGVASFDATLAEFSQFLTARRTSLQTVTRVFSVSTALHQENLAMPDTQIPDCPESTNPAVQPPPTEMPSQENGLVEPIPQENTAAVRREAAAIAETCLLAGFPEQAAGFIAAGKNAADVRRSLLHLKAERQSPEIVSLIAPDAGVSAATTDDGAALRAAIKKLHPTKE